MILFPKHLVNNLIASIAVLIFPGFLQQLNALDYQAHFISHLAMMMSFLICLLPIYFKKNWLYFISIPFSILLMLVSVGLIEWMIGLDLFRYFAIFMAYKQSAATNQNGKSSSHLDHPRTKPRASYRKKFFLYSLPYMITTATYSLWRVLFFDSARVNVDAKQMLSSHSTTFGFFQGINSLLQNVYKQVISAWYEPFRIHFNYLLPDLIFPVLLMCLIGGIVIFLFLKLDNLKEIPSNDRSYSLSLLAGGLIIVIGALVPIIFGGREISYTIPANRFAYPGMIGSGMLLAGILSLVKFTPRVILLYLLIVTSLLAHYGNSVKFEINNEITRTTWWQLAWRAPDIDKKTTVTGKLDQGNISESHVIWSPINLIYYSDRRFVIVTAEVLNEVTKEWIINGAESYQVKRGNSFVNNFAQMLLFSRPAGSCLHLIDGKSPEISEFDHDLIREIAPYSSLEWINTESDKELVISRDIFGPEPEHDWCYYYQKAQLARQERDWEGVSELGNKAIELNFLALDPIEWLVFLQGFAYTQDPDYSIALDIILKDDYVSSEACAVFLSYSEEIQNSLYEEQHDKLLSDLCSK
jgi:hypothetical protein